MPSPAVLRRALAGLVVTVGLACVAGCTTTGEITVGTDSVTVDLRMLHPQDQVEGCDAAEAIPGLTVLDRSLLEEQVSCRVVGTIDLRGEVSDAGAYLPTVVTAARAGTGMRAVLSSSGGYQFLVVPRPLFTASGEAEQPEFFGPTDLDVVIHFPGPVVAATDAAEVDGNSVRLRDAAKLQAEALGVTARLVADPIPPALLPAGVGLTLGALGCAIAVALRRAALAGAPGSTSVSGPGGESASESQWRLGVSESAGRLASHGARAPEATIPPQDPSVWAPDHS